jgi:hypothetical protein
MRTGAVGWIDRARQTGVFAVEAIRSKARVDPGLEALRDDPRFHDVINR